MRPENTTVKLDQINGESVWINQDDIGAVRHHHSTRILALPGGGFFEEEFIDGSEILVQGHWIVIKGPRSTLLRLLGIPERAA